MDSNAQQGFPTLCSNGCGFFSSVDSKGLCSVCYKEEQKKNAPPTQSTTTTTTTSTNTSKSDLHQPPTLSENSINVESESKSEASSIAVAQTPSTSAHTTEEEKDDPMPAKKPKKN